MENLVLSCQVTQNVAGGPAAMVESHIAYSAQLLCSRHRDIWVCASPNLATGFQLLHRIEQKRVDVCPDNVWSLLHAFTRLELEAKQIFLLTVQTMTPAACVCNHLHSQ